MSEQHVISTLRALILRAAPDERMALPVATCSPDALLDSIIPFSSLIVLGVIVAVEDDFNIRVSRHDLEATLNGGATLAKLAHLVESIQRRSNED